MVCNGVHCAMMCSECWTHCTLHIEQCLYTFVGAFCKVFLSLFVQFAVHGADDVMHGAYNASCNCAYNALCDGAYYQVWWEERAESH